MCIYLLLILQELFIYYNCVYTWKQFNFSTGLVKA